MNKNKVSRLLLSASVMTLTLTAKIQADDAAMAGFAAIKAERVAEIKNVMQANGITIDPKLESNLGHDNFVMNFKQWQSQDPKIMLAFVQKGIDHLNAHGSFSGSAVESLQNLISKQFNVTDLFNFSDELLVSPVLSRLIKPSDIKTYAQADKWAKTQSGRGEYGEAAKYYEIAADYAVKESAAVSVVTEARENAALAYREQIITSVTKKSDRTEADIDAGVEIAVKGEKIADLALTARAFDRVVLTRTELSQAYEELAAAQSADASGVLNAARLYAKAAEMRKKTATYNISMAQTHKGQMKNNYIEAAVVQHALVVQRYIDAFKKSNAALGTKAYGLDGKTYDWAAKDEAERLAGTTYVDALVNKAVGTDDNGNSVNGEDVVMSKASEAMIRAETAQILYKITGGTGFFPGDSTGASTSLILVLTGTGGVLASGEAAAAVAYGALYSNSSVKEQIYGAVAKARAAETAMKYVRNAGSFSLTTSETVVSRDATEAVETALDDAEKALKPTDVKVATLKAQKKVVEKWVRFANTFWAKRIAAEVTTTTANSVNYAAYMEAAYAVAKKSGHADAWEALIPAADKALLTTEGTANNIARAKCAAYVCKSFALLNRHNESDDNLAYAKATETSAGTGYIVDAATQANAISDNATKASALLAVIDAYKHVLQEHNGGTVVMQGAREALYTQQVARAVALRTVEDADVSLNAKTKLSTVTAFEKLQKKMTVGATSTNEGIGLFINNVTADDLLNGANDSDLVDVLTAAGKLNGGATPYASYVEAEADIMSRLKTLVSDETTYDEAYAAYEEGIASKLAWCSNQISSKGSEMTEAERKAVADAYAAAADSQESLLVMKTILNGNLVQNGANVGYAGIVTTDGGGVALAGLVHANMLGQYVTKELIDEVAKLAKYRRLAADNYKLSGTTNVGLMNAQADKVLDVAASNSAFEVAMKLIDKYVSMVQLQVNTDAGVVGAPNVAGTNGLRNEMASRIAGLYKSLEAVADEAVLAAENTTAGANTDIGNIKALLTDNDDIVSATVGLGLVEKYDALATTKANLSSKTSITNAFNSGIRILKKLATKRTTTTDYDAAQNALYGQVYDEINNATNGSNRVALRSNAASTSITTANARLSETADAAEAAVALAEAAKSYDLTSAKAIERQQRAALASGLINSDLEAERLAQVLEDTTPATATEKHDAYKNFARIANAKAQMSAYEAELGADTSAEAKSFYKTAAANYVLAAEAKASDTSFAAGHNAVMADLYEKAATAYMNAGDSDKENANLLLAATYYGRDRSAANIDKAIAAGTKLAAKESSSMHGHYKAHLARMYIEHKNEFEVASGIFRKAVAGLLASGDYSQAESVAAELAEVARMTNTVQAYTASAEAHMDMSKNAGFEMHKRALFAAKAGDEYVAGKEYVKAAESYRASAVIESDSGAHSPSSKQYTIAAWAYGQAATPDQQLIAEVNSLAAKQARLAGGSDSAHDAAVAAHKAADAVLANSAASGDSQRATLEFAVQAYVSAASAYFADARVEDSKSALKKATDLLEKIGGSNNTITSAKALSYSNVADVYAEMLDNTRAREFYISAANSYKASSANADRVMAMEMYAKAVSAAKKDGVTAEMIDFAKRSEDVRSLIGEVIVKAEGVVEDSAEVKKVKADAMLSLASLYLDLGEVDLERQAKVEALLNKADAAYAATDYSMRIKSALLRVKAISQNGEVSSDADSRADMQRLVSIISAAEANLAKIASSEAKVTDATRLAEAARVAVDAYNKHNFLTTAPDVFAARDDLNGVKQMRDLMLRASAMARSEADLVVNGYDVALAASRHAAEGLVSFMKAIANMMKSATGNAQATDLLLLKGALDTVIVESYESMKAHTRARVIDIEKSALMETEVARAVNATQNAMNIVAQVRSSDVVKDEAGDKEAATMAEQEIENHKAALASSKAEAAAIVTKIKATDSTDSHTDLISQSKSAASKGLDAMFSALKQAAVVVSSKPTKDLKVEDVHTTLGDMKKHLFGTDTEKGLLDHKEEVHNNRSQDSVKTPS